MIEQPKMVVLIVDDCIEMIALLSAYLAHPSIEVLTATAGRQGVELFKSGKVDLVLLDIEMPEMDGFAVLAAMREFETREHRGKTPIMAVTAASDITSSYRILSSGFDLHLVKPISRVTLLQTVGQFRGKHPEATKVATEASARKQLGDYLPTFVEHRTQDVLRLQKAVDDNDYEAVKALGASLKNVATSFGFDSLWQIGARIESGAVSGQLETVKADIEEYNSYLHRIWIGFPAKRGRPRTRSLSPQP